MLADFGLSICSSCITDSSSVRCKSVTGSSVFVTIFSIMNRDILLLRCSNIILFLQRMMCGLQEFSCSICSSGSILSILIRHVWQRTFWLRNETVWISLTKPFILYDSQSWVLWTRLRRCWFVIVVRDRLCLNCCLIRGFRSVFFKFNIVLGNILCFASFVIFSLVMKRSFCFNKTHNNIHVYRGS